MTCASIPDKGPSVLHPGGPTNLMNNLRPLITIGEAASLLGVSTTEIEQYLNKGILSGVTYRGVTMLFRNRVVLLLKGRQKPLEDSL